MTNQSQHQPTGVYSDTEIIAGLEQGHIVCDPTPAQINGSSIDVTLGYYFYRAGGSKENSLFNPFDQASTRQYFGDYLIAKPWREARRKISRPEVANIDTLAGIDDDHPVIVLHPNERILAHTHEFIGILPPGTTSMQARSTTGRIGISACYCAGWGDPGYINRWTMEIHNLNEYSYVVLPIGYRIAQIVFSATGPVATEYAQASGNYQPSGNTDLAMVKQAWRPWMMLPRAYASPVKLPPPVTGLSDGLM